MDSQWSGMIAFIAAIATEALFFGFGAAIQNLNAAEIEHHMETGDRQAAQILRIMNRPGKFIHTLQLLSVLLPLAGGGIFLRHPAARLSAALSAELHPPAASLLSGFLCLCAAAVLFVSFGAVLPKRLALRSPEKWARRCLAAVRFGMALLTPLRLPAEGISRLMLRLFGIDPDSQEENVTEEDIMSMVNEGHEQGVVESDEAEMITNIFELNDKTAGDIMTHRKHVTGLDSALTLSEAVDFILNEARNSRFPVYRGEIDNIIGVLNMKDAMIAAHSGKYAERRLTEIPGLLREAHFIPETRTLDSLFREMQSQKIHMTIVVDEYGQTAGIVTMEDILEEIVGNIVDEYDSEEELITALPDGSWIMGGMTPLADAEEAAGIAFTEEEREDFDTLNGFLIARLNRIPADGERLRLSAHGFAFDILKVQNKMIRTVKVVWIGEQRQSGAALP